MFSSLIDFLLERENLLFWFTMEPKTQDALHFTQLTNNTKKMFLFLGTRHTNNHKILTLNIFFFFVT